VRALAATQGTLRSVSTRTTRTRGRAVLVAALVAVAALAAVPPGAGSVAFGTAAAVPPGTASVAFGTAAAVPPGTASAGSGNPCPGGRNGAGWTLSTTTFDQNYSKHAYVGNGYLSQRVPATGMGYLSTGEKTGWPLYTPRYDGAFVAGLYGADPAIESGKTIDAAIPTWSTLTLTSGSKTYSATTPAGQVSNYTQALSLGCGLLRTRTFLRTLNDRIAA